MANMTGLFTLGRDAELRVSPKGTSILSMALVYNYGQRENGRQPSQWIDAVMFGKRAESIADYLKKGQQISCLLSDVHVRTYQKKDGSEGHSLSGNVQDLEFVKSGEKREKSAAAPRAEAAPEFDDDVPF